MTNAQRDYQAWLLHYTASNRVEHSTNKSQLLVEQADFNSGVTDGKRRGFNGKQPRSRARALSHCICTRADGSQYIMGEKNDRTPPREAYRPSLISTLAPIGNNL